MPHVRRCWQHWSQMGLSPTVRGEVLTLEQFAQLSNLLVEEA